MPLHTHYVEPYFGGGAVLLAKNPESNQKHQRYENNSDQAFT